jgi:SecD/SecF fusion protein
VICSVIASGSGEISGDFTSQEAGQLALLLRAGALPVPLEVIEERSVGPDLGRETINMGLTTGLIGFVLVVEFMLALIGYSVNDKVVVFDRVRESLRATPDKPLLTLLNESIAATLARTVYTSITTVLTLLPMALAGGSAVASSAQPMLFGVVIGTSSSVFIAAPLLYWLAQRRVHRGEVQLRPSADEIRQQLAQMP